MTSRDSIRGNLIRSAASRLWWPIALLPVSLPAADFDFELRKTEYLPGEKLQIVCRWPERKPSDAGMVTLIPYKAGLLGKERERFVPSAHFLYDLKYGVPDCVDLRAPWAPGEYQLEATVATRPPTPPVRRPIVVGELPEDDIVEYVGITIRDPLGTAKDGEFFEYTLTFQNDRCYPSYTWWKADKRDVAVFLVERSTREVRSVDTFLQKTGINCLENCSDPIIPYACRPAGTHTHFARIPAHAGVWDLSIGQVALPGETCVGRCVTIPPRNDGEPGQRYRILDQAPTVEPVDVKTIYATQHRDGSKALDLAQVLDRPFYLWVEFVEDNPFPVEIVDVTLVNEQADAEPVTVRRYQSNYRLYRSEQLTGRSFRPKQDAESGR